MLSGTHAARGEQAFALALSAVLCIAAAAALSVPWARTFVVPGFPFVSIATTWAIFDLLTACFLFARFYVSGRALFGWVGAAYGFSGLLTVAYLAAYLAFSGLTHRTVGDQQIAATLYIAWHIVFATLVPVGVYLDRKFSSRIRKERVTGAVRSVVTVVVLTAAIVSIAAFVGRDRLPIFALDGVMEPTLANAMQIVAALSGIALVIVLVLFRGRLYGLAVWLSVSLLTSMLEAELNAASPHLFSVVWDLGKLLTLATSSFVMIQTIIATLQMYGSISKMMELRSQTSGARLRAIWQIATSEGLAERDHVQLVLDVATANLRSRHNVFGFASELEEDHVRIVATSRYGDSAAHERISAVYEPGAKVALPDGLHDALVAEGGTQFWQLPGDLPDGPAKAAGWCAAIGTSIRVGAQTHFLVLGSPDRLDTDGFVESDVAFVEVAAAILSRRYFESFQLKRIEFQSEHDGLTGVYNRTVFRRLGRAALADRSLRAVVLINLDGFAEVNHRLGQMAGDDILVEVAASLVRVDSRDIVARISGDEFAVLLEDGGERDLAVAFDAYKKLFQTPFATGDREGKAFVDVTASIGIAVVADSTATFEDLLVRAAVALEQSKGRGGNTITQFGAELHSLLEQRSVERAELVEGLAADALFIEYQPIFELNAHVITGAEALVRWMHPTRGVIRPETLLPAMRRANLLNELTCWVMRRVARDLTGVRLPRGFRCFFNVPAQVLESESFLSNLRQVLFANPELRDHLGIEVTESEVMHDVERAVESLNRARLLGLMVAVDDFGTGYSSLNYLKRLPVDVLKLDKTFIQGLPDDRKDVALAELFLALSRQIGFVSLGEGIETEAQAEWLRLQGCMLGQGFLYSKPMPYAALMELVRDSVA